MVEKKHSKFIKFEIRGPKSMFTELKKKTELFSFTTGKPKMMHTFLQDDNFLIVMCSRQVLVSRHFCALWTITPTHSAIIHLYDPMNDLKLTWNSIIADKIIAYSRIYDCSKKENGHHSDAIMTFFYFFQKLSSNF